MTTTVRQMLAGKPDVFAVAPDDTVYTALNLMSERNVGAVLVMRDGTVLGILSERDYARKMVLHGRASHDTQVRDVMTEKVISVGPDWSADQCMALMTERRIRHLPVTEQDRLIGVISIGDVVRAVVDEQQFTISSLESYIMSGG